jgi:hypothetical protein
VAARRRYRVYVIELHNEDGWQGDPSIPWVYVGHTAKRLQERWREHAEGVRGRSTKWTDGRCGPLLPDLYATLEAVATRAEAEELERALSIRLHEAGYGVHGDGLPRELRRRRGRGRRG